TNRMVCQYMLEHYQVCAERYTRLTADDCARLRALAAWERRVRGAWGEVRAWEVSAAGTEAARVGGEIRVACRVALGSLAPEDVAVQVYHGRLDEHGRIGAAQAVDLAGEGEAGAGVFRYAGRLPCERSGRMGFAVRVLPRHEDQLHPHELRLMRWAE
ncbi:MAG: alpha-glucan phosphorylase, partial [Candidatus Eisenbacteria bacterium]|nr:alpha-glucan phosphorylase [Candidatus Eisenbacteria bacterium]